MIRRLHIENFKAIRDLSLEFGKVAVFVGPNSSGKTSVLEAIRLSFLAGHKSPELVFMGRHSHESLVSFGAPDETMVLEWEGGEHGKPVDISVKLFSKKAAAINQWIVQARVTANVGGFLYKSESCSPAQDLGGPWPIPFFIWKVGLPFLLAFELSNLSEPSYSEELIPAVRSDGSGLASALTYMASNNPDAFVRLQEDLRKIIPEVRRVRTRRAKIQRQRQQVITVDGQSITRNFDEEIIGDEILIDMQHAEGLPAYAVSEGTLIALGLLAVLHSEQRPSLLLIDDLEHGLHPAALGKMVAVLRDLQEQHEDLQIMATTHSPYLLDHFDAEEVFLTVLDDQGHTLCAKLTEHPEYEKWKDDMAPGEFWSFAAEDWIKQRAATPGAGE